MVNPIPEQKIQGTVSMTNQSKRELLELIKNVHEEIIERQRCFGLLNS